MSTTEEESEGWAFRERVCEDPGSPHTLPFSNAMYENNKASCSSCCLPRTCQRGFRHQDEMLQLPNPGGLCLNVVLGKHKCLKKKTAGCGHFVCLIQLYAFLLPVARVCDCQGPWLSKWTFHFPSWCSSHSQSQPEESTLTLLVFKAFETESFGIENFALVCALMALC